MIERSFGIIPAKKDRAGRWKFLIVQHGKGHWGFPKGHPEAGEEPLQTASRELLEETGLSISELLVPAPLIEKYFFTFRGQKIFKTVNYFLARVVGRVTLQTTELTAYKWVLAEEASSYITFPQAKQLSHEAFLLLSARAD